MKPVVLGDPPWFGKIPLFLLNFLCTLPLAGGHISLLCSISFLVLDMLESTVAGFGLERPMVGVHIRRTDKVDNSRNPTTTKKP